MSAPFSGFHPRLLVEAMPIVDARAELAAEERDVVARVSAGRLCEYTTGRLLARDLLRRLGLQDPVVTRYPDRSPRWPSGFVGSIAHCDRRCIVAVARKEDFASVGIDIEPADELESELFDTIATEHELRRLEVLPGHERGLEARRLFTAKEAAYKCAYPLLGAFLDFHDVSVEFSAGGHFAVAVAHPAARRFEFEGNLAELHGCLHALVVSPTRVPVSRS
jgi:4'-phosphopantetheinyl transferase EntD